MRWLVMLFLFCIYEAYTVDIEDCGSESGKILDVFLSCTGDTKCILKSGQNLTMNIQFTSIKDVDSVKTVVVAQILSVALPVSVPNSNACENSGLLCPLQKGNVYNYTEELYIPKTYPKVTMTIKWTLLDEHQKKIVCASFPAQVE